MTHITKHHTKEPRECDTGNKSWVCFQVCWHTICIYNVLESIKHYIWLEVGRPCNLVIVESIHFGRLESLQSCSDLVFMLNWSPEVADKALVLHLHHIQALVECLLFCQEHFVNVDSRGALISTISCLSWNSIKDAQLLSQ